MNVLCGGCLTRERQGEFVRGRGTKGGERARANSVVSLDRGILRLKASDVERRRVRDGECVKVDSVAEIRSGGLMDALVVEGMISQTNARFSIKCPAVRDALACLPIVEGSRLTVAVVGAFNTNGLGDMQTTLNDKLNHFFQGIHVRNGLGECLFFCVTSQKRIRIHVNVFFNKYSDRTTNNAQHCADGHTVIS